MHDRTSAGIGHAHGASARGSQDHDHRPGHEHGGDHHFGRGHRGEALVGWRRVGALLRHDHEHGNDPVPDDTAIHAAKVSLVALTLTALAQLGVALVSGSVALLSDTVHNFSDALTAIPLWVAFVLHRRPPNRRFTHGYNRAEDFAGLLVLVAIAASAGLVIYESVNRLLHPRALEHAAWVIAAGLIGALGNEFVARYRIRAGRRVGSAALTADGVHARTDALTSLVVVVAGIGALLGAQWADPVAGLLVGVFILLMLRHSAARVFVRLLDAVDPDLVDLARSTTEEVEGVRQVTDLRLRWHGHQLQAIALVSVDPLLSVEDGHHISQQVEHALMHAFPHTMHVVVHVDPHGATGSHEVTRHHQ